MSTYKSQYTGAQIDEAVGKALAGAGSGSNSGGSISSLVSGFVRIDYYQGDTYQGCKYVPIGSSDFLDDILERAGAFYSASTYSVCQYFAFHFGSKYYYYKIEGLSNTGAITASYEEIHSIQVNDAAYQAHYFTDGEVIKIVLTAPASSSGSN